MSPGDPDRARRSWRGEMEPLPPRSVLVVFVLLVVLAVLVEAYDGLRPREIESSWRLVRSDPASKVILIEATIGNSCRKFKQIDLEETSERVTISVRSSVPRKWASEDCLDYSRRECHTVELASPLGSRSIHGGLPSVDPEARCNRR